MKDTLTLIEVIENAIHTAKATGYVWYVVEREASYEMVTEWQKGWLFRAWPGGRKEFSVAGAAIARELGYIK